MSRMRLFFLLATAVAFSAPLAEACQDLRFSPRQATFDLTKNPNPVLNIDVQADTAATGCSYFLTFGYGSGTSPWNRALRLDGDVWPLHLSKDASLNMTLREITDAQAAEHVLSGHFRAGAPRSRAVLSYRAALDPLNRPQKVGRFHETVLVSLYEGTPGQHTLRASRTMTFFAEASPTMAFVLRDREIRFSPEVGAEEARTLEAEVRANTDFRLRLFSVKDKTVKTGGRSEGLSYHLSANGAVIGLDGVTANSVEITGVDQRRRTLNLRAERGPLAQPLGAERTDELTLSLESVE